MLFNRFLIKPGKVAWTRKLVQLLSRLFHTHRCFARSLAVFENVRGCFKSLSALRSSHPSFGAEVPSVPAGRAALFTGVLFLVCEKHSGFLTAPGNVPLILELGSLFPAFQPPALRWQHRVPTAEVQRGFAASGAPSSSYEKCQKLQFCCWNSSL